MVDPRRQRFLPYLRMLADLMGLKDWDFTIADDQPSDSVCAASIGFIFGKKLAKVWLNTEFLDDTPEHQRESMVHELIHPHFEDGWEIAVEAMPATVEPAFRRMMEHGIAGVAKAWAKTLPLPTFDPT